MSDNFYYKNNPLVKLSSNLSSNDSSTDTNFLINGIDVKNLYLTSNNTNISSITKTGVGGDGNDKYSISGSKNLANTTTTSSIVGMNSSVHAIAIDSNNNVYVGGTFTIAGEVSANCIAKWNGSTWTALGTGMNSSVYAIAIDSNNNVYAGGNFTTAGGVSANYIAKWNGSTWTALGTGLNTYVTTIAIDSNNNVYAGGNFTTAGGVSANRIAKWNGSTWTALGINDLIDNYIGYPAISRIVIDSINNVYIVGRFDTINTTAGAVSANHIAKWNGTTWSALGTGTSFNVMSIAIDSNNNVYYISTNNRGYPFIKCIYSFTNLSNCYFNSSNNNSLFYYNNT